MTILKNFLARLRPDNLCLLFLTLAFLSLLAVLLSPWQLSAAPLSLSEREQFEFSIEYLEKNGHIKEAEQFRQLLQTAKVHLDDLASGTNAETLDGHITFNRSLFTGRAIQDPESLRRFGMVSSLAQVIIHELKHVNQAGSHISASNINNLLGGDNPAEQEGWGAAMQSTLDSIVRLEFSLATSDKQEQLRISDMILTLCSDLLSSYNGLKDSGYGEVLLRGPEGNTLNEASVRRYLSAVQKQSEAIKDNRRPEPGTRATTRDQAEANQYTVGRFQKRWDSLEDEKKEIFAAMNETDAKKQLEDKLQAMNYVHAIMVRRYSLRKELISACSELETLKDKVLRFTQAGRGAQENIEQDLVSARGVQCLEQSDLTFLQNLYDSSVRHAANLQKLFAEAAIAHESYEHFDRILKSLYKIHEKNDPRELSQALNLSYAEADYKDFLELVDEFEQIYEGQVKLLDRLDAYLADLEQFKQSISAEVAIQRPPELVRFYDLAYKPNLPLWPVNRQMLTGLQERFNRVRSDADKVLKSFSNDLGTTPTDCDHKAVLEQAIDDIKEAVSWSILKVAAIEELKEKCSETLGITSAPPGQAADDGGFEDEAAEVDSGEAGSTDGSADEADRENGTDQNRPDDLSGGQNGFGDESDDAPSWDVDIENVTYFDRDFMPQSWLTSGNSRQARVHIFSLGSRLGWAAALAGPGAPQAIELIIDHLNGASDHVKGAYDNSFLPMKAYKDWEQIQKKHQYWVQKLEQRPNLQGRERQLKTLAGSFKSHAMGLAEKIAFQAGGNGLEQRENCDSYYLRIGYYLAYASQSLSFASQAQSAGAPQKYVNKMQKEGQSAASSAAQYMRNLKKIKPATGYCLDLNSQADLVFQGTRRGPDLPAKAQAAQKGWADTLEALGGFSSGSPDMEKIGRYVFSDMQKFLPQGLEKVNQGAFEGDGKMYLGPRYHFGYNKAFRFDHVTDHNPGFHFNISHQISDQQASKLSKCEPWQTNIRVINNGNFKRHGGEGIYCLRKNNGYAGRETLYSLLFWSSGQWSITIQGQDEPNHPATMFGPAENSLKYLMTVFDDIVPRLTKAVEMYGDSGKVESGVFAPTPGGNRPQQSGSSDRSGIDLLNIEAN